MKQTETIEHATENPVRSTSEVGRAAAGAGAPDTQQQQQQQLSPGVSASRDLSHLTCQLQQGMGVFTVPATITNSDGGGGGSGSGSADSGGQQHNFDNSTGLVLAIMSPVFLFYLMYPVVNYIPVDGVPVIDSEGFKHTVRLRTIANFNIPWLFLFTIDLLCLCPAHYWLTLYQATSAAVDWNGQGNARGRVKAVVTVVETLTRGETIHFLMTMMPLMSGVVINFAYQGNNFGSG